MSNPANHLIQRSLIRWLFDSLIDWLVIFVTIFLAVKSHNVLAYVFAMFIVANRQHALSQMGHDATHRTVCKNRWLNDLLGNAFCFWPMTSTIEGYRRLHFTHHRFTGTDKDPELIYKRRAAVREDWKPGGPGKLIYLLLRDLVTLGYPNMLMFLYDTRPASFKDALPMLTFSSIITIFLFLNGFMLPMTIWYGGLFIFFWPIFRVRMWIEHVGTLGTHRVRLTWWESWLFAPHNTWYHWEHHEWPAVPYWNLPKARALNTTEKVLSYKELWDFLKKAGKEN